MIFNCTKKTKERFNINYWEEYKDEIEEKEIIDIIEKEKEDSFFNWGLKYFAFDRRKCIQLIHFETKFNLYLFDIKVADMSELGNIIAYYLLELYKTDQEVTELLEDYFKESQLCVYTKLTNKSAISTLNGNEWQFALGGERFYEYIDNNILKTLDINKDANWNNLVTINKKYIVPGKEFKRALIERYK